MSVRYVNCLPTERLDARSARAVYRIRLVRVGALRDWLTSSSLGTRDWREIIRQLEDRLPTLGNSTGMPFVFQLGNAAVTADSTVAVIDVRVGSQPGGATVANLVNGVEDLTPYAEVQSVEWFRQVPGLDDGGANAFNDSRGEEQINAQAEDDARRPSITDTLRAGLLNVAFGIGAAIVVAYLIKSEE